MASVMKEDDQCATSDRFALSFLALPITPGARFSSIVRKLALCIFEVRGVPKMHTGNSVVSFKVSHS